MAVAAWLVVAVLAVVVLLPNDQITRQSLWTVRDRWVALSAWLAAALLLLTDWPLAFAWAAVVVHWTRTAASGRADPPWFKAHESLLTWVAILGWWLLVQHLPPPVIATLPALFTLCMIMHSGAVVVDWATRAGRKATYTRGLAGQRGLTAAMLALLVPFAWAVSPWWTLAALPGLVIVDSWLAYLALIAAGAVLYPPSLWVTLPTIGVAAVLLSVPSWRMAVDHTPRGTSLDGPRQRVYSILMLAYYWCRQRTWLWGRGPDGSLNDLVRIMYRHFPHDPTAIISGHPHNEYVEYVYDAGILALVAVGGLGWRVVGHLAAADPWSAAVVAGAVLAGGTVITKSASTGLVWLTALAVLTR